MKKTLLACAVSTALLAPSLVNADVSANVGLVSDYTFNGVSQTDNGPALQAGLDYDAGVLYVGTWASNVDFGDTDDTNIEWDFYAGKYFQVSQAVSIDAGLAYYTYHGQDNEAGRTASDDYAYPEAYGKFGLASELGQSELNLWYSWDYFGLGGGHHIVMLAHSIEVAEGHSLRLSVDQSTSMDDEKWQWDGEDSYVHYRLGYETSFEGFDLSLAVEDTSMSDVDTADARVVAGISRSFGF